jgi:hypothetical protein
MAETSDISKWWTQDDLPQPTVRKRAVRSRMRRRSSFAATPSMARTSSAKSDVVSTTGSAIERRPAPDTLHVASDHHKIGCVAREAVNGRDDDDIAGREGLHKLCKLRPVGGRAGDLLAECPFAPGRLQLGKLAAKVSCAGRDAGIAVNHAAIMHRKSASKKRNRVSVLVLILIFATWRSDARLYGISGTRELNYGVVSGCSPGQVVRPHRRNADWEKFVHETTKAHCNKCGGSTNHDFVAIEKKKIFGRKMTNTKPATGLICTKCSSVADVRT